MNLIRHIDGNEHDLFEGMISFIRIPLAICVIFVHSSPEHYIEYSRMSPLLSSNGVFTIYANIISFLSDCAVPSFFLISGYLFAYKIDTLDINIIKRKLTRRIHSLLVPFIFWNLLVLLWGCVIIIYSSCQNRGDVCSSLYDYLASLSLYEVFIVSKDYGCPIYMIMWFVRDLVILSLFAPIIFFCVKHLKLISLFVISYFFVFTDLHIIWLKMPSIFYFSFGMLLSANKVDVIKYFNKTYFFLIIILLFVFFFFYSITKVPEEIVNISQFLVVISFFFMAFFFVKKKRYIMPNVSSSVFFVYCIHVFQFANKCTLAALSTLLLQKTIGQIPFLGCYLSYTLAPLLTFVICYLIYVLIIKLTPRLGSIISGNNRQIFSKIR